MAGTAVTTIVAADAADATRRMAAQIAEVSRSGAGVAQSIALSGGSTPKLLYETLAAPPFHDRVRWDRLELFFGDERAVPPHDPESNYGMVRRALLDHVPATAHRMAAETGDAAGYERLMGERIKARRDGFAVLDLVLLGIGKDGHTASLFPGTAALLEAQRWVVMNDVPQLQTRRMTMTYPLINRARRVWVLATGADKREIVAQCLAVLASGESAPQWPITGVRPLGGQLVWWLDEAARG